MDGKLKNAKKIQIKDSAADYINPYLADNGGKLYFASNRAGGKGGFDIYVIEKKNGFWETTPMNFNCINTENDENAPSANSVDLYFSSNRAGGLGGFDVYRTSLNSNSNACVVNNPLIS